MCKFIQISSMLWNFVVTVVTKPRNNWLKKQLLIKLLLTRNRLWPASTEYKAELDQKKIINNGEAQIPNIILKPKFIKSLNRQKNSTKREQLR